FRRKKCCRVGDRERRPILVSKKNHVAVFLRRGGKRKKSNENNGAKKATHAYHTALLSLSFRYPRQLPADQGRCHPCNNSVERSHGIPGPREARTLHGVHP